MTLAELGLTYSAGYTITDLFDNVNYGHVLPDKRFKVDVNPSGTAHVTLFVSIRQIQHIVCVDPSGIAHYFCQSVR